LAAAKAGKSPSEVCIPFYVMTSPQTDEATQGFFKEHNYFGLDPHREIFFFQQGTLPCFTKDGKIMMETPSKVATAPDGNGGIYMALHEAKVTGQERPAIQLMQQQGLKGVMVFAVDNAVCKIGDPYFVGRCLAEDAELGVKVVPKAHDEEKVGNLVMVAKASARSCMMGGAELSHQVIEYTEMPSELASKKNSTGGRMFDAGSICIHYYSLDFMLSKCNKSSLPKEYHVAKKDIPCAQLIDDKAAVTKAVREEEFSPVKNANMTEEKDSNGKGTGVFKETTSDCPRTAAEIISNLHKSWLLKAGATFVGDSSAMLEISPLVSYGGEGLECFKGQAIKFKSKTLNNSSKSGSKTVQCAYIDDNYVAMLLSGKMRGCL